MVESNENELNYMNKELFDKQIMFSLNAKLIFRPYNVIGDSILYHDRFRREYYYGKSKSESDYPEVKMKLMKENLKINENEKFLWITIPEMARINEELDSIAKNNRLFTMDKVFHFPFSLLKDGRIYILDQYSSEIGETVTQRILKLKNNYDRVLGPNSMDIESIGSDLMDAVEFIKIMGLRVTIIELKIKLKWSGEDINGLLKTTSSDLKGIQFLIKNNKGHKVLNFEDTKNSNIAIDDILESAREIFRISSLFILYADFRCKDGKCIFTILFEEKLGGAVSEALERVVEKGIALQIWSYRKLI